MHRSNLLPAGGIRTRAHHLARALMVVVALGAATLGVATPAVGQSTSDAPVALVRITTANVAGVYTISWRTLGGCDPGEGTSGESGEITLTVKADGSPDDTPVAGELRGTPVVGSLIVRSFCTYTWSVSMVEATTEANCVVGPAPFAPDERNIINVTLDDPATSCAQRSRIVVRINPAVPVSIDDTDHNAILRTRFIVTARRIEDAPRRCSTRTGISKLDDNDTPDDTIDDTVAIELRVLATTADGAACRYDVTLRVPRQLAATHGEHEHNVFEDVEPGATIDFRVGVVTKTIQLVQTVTGDSGGAGARYKLTRTCGEPVDTEVPDPLLPEPTGGIVKPIGSVTTVELRGGSFNISAVLAEDPSADDAFDGLPVRVLDNQGETCEATVSVSHLPEQCVAEEASFTVELVRATEPTVLEFKITCGGDEDDDTDDGDSDDGDSDDDTTDGGSDTDDDTTDDDTTDDDTTDDDTTDDDTDDV